MTEKIYRVYANDSERVVEYGTTADISVWLHPEVETFYHAFDVKNDQMVGLFAGPNGVTRVIESIVGVADMPDTLRYGNGDHDYLRVGNVAYFLAHSNTFRGDELWMANIYDHGGVDWAEAIVAKTCFEWTGTQFENMAPTVNRLELFAQQLRGLGTQSVPEIYRPTQKV